MSEVPQRTESTEKKVTWTELFFDLVLVFAITQITALLDENHGWAALGQALIVFVPIYWAWVGTSVHCNLHDTDNAIDRAGILALALCALFMAVAVPQAYEQRGALFGGAYFALRAILAGLYFRGRPITLVTPLVAACVTGPLMLAGGLVPTPARTVLWGLAAAVDLATPRVLRRRLMAVAFDAGHLVERFGGPGRAADRGRSARGGGVVRACGRAVVGLLRLRHERDPARAVDRPDPDRHRPSGAQLGPPVLRGRHHRGGGRPH